MAEYVNLFDTLYGGAKWDVGVAINRSNALPLDRNSIFPSYELARAYAAMDEAAMSAELTRLGLEDVKINNNAYAGQVLAVVTESETVVYYIDANKQLQEVGSKVETDEKSIVLGEDGKLYIAGFKDAGALTLPQKQADGSILWVPISSIVEGDGNTVTEIAAADKSINVETKESSDSSIKYDVKVNLSSEEGNQLSLKDDGLFIKVEGYDDSEIRGLINNKADASALDNYYTKGEVDSAIDADVKVVGDKVATLEEQIKGLSGAMHFKGVKKELPENTEGYVDGDVIIVGDKEYVCSGNAWKLFGDVSAEGERLSDLEKAVNETIPANYALKSELPTVPTDVSAFNNDAGYITKDVNDLSNYDTTSVVEGKIESAINGLNIGDYAKTSYVDEKVGEKQDIISDLATIREGAGKGATALQSDAIADMLTKTEAQGIYATIATVNGIDGRVGSLETEIAKKQDKLIPDVGILIGEDNKIKIDDSVIASQSEFNALDGRVGEIEGALPGINSSIEELNSELGATQSDLSALDTVVKGLYSNEVIDGKIQAVENSVLVKSVSEELSVNSEGKLSLIDVAQGKVSGLNKITSVKNDDGVFVDTVSPASLSDILTLASYDSSTKSGQAGLMSVADKEKLSALIIGDNGIEVSGKVSVENVEGLPSYLNKKIDKVEFADVELPGIVAEGAGLEQIVKYQLPLISSKDVKEINVNKLVQTEGDELILNGGTASKTSA